MDNPELAAKAAIAKAEAEAKTLESDAATYEKSFVAWVIANKTRVITVVALVILPLAIMAVLDHFHLLGPI
jgi:hypothetical protein